MGSPVPHNGQPKTNEISAYCAFKNDRDRLYALVSRDIRLVVLAAVALFATPILSAQIGTIWMALKAMLR